MFNSDLSTNREANRVVHACLAQERSKAAVKKDYLRKVTETADRNFPALELGKEKLEKIFGLTLAPTVDNAGYVVVSTLLMPCLESPIVLPGPPESDALFDELNEEEDDEFLDLTESNIEKAKQLCLMSILACIYMDTDRTLSGHKVDRLLSGLFGFTLGEKNHDQLGNVNELILHEWTRQRYLKVTKSRDNAEDVMQSQFEWGERATYAVSKRQILNFIAKMQGADVKPEDYQDKIKDAEYQEKNHFGGKLETTTAEGTKNDGEITVIENEESSSKNRMQKQSSATQPSSSSNGQNRRLSARQSSSTQMPTGQQQTQQIVSRVNDIMYQKRNRRL